MVSIAHSFSPPSFMIYFLHVFLVKQFYKVYQEIEQSHICFPLNSCLSLKIIRLFFYIFFCHLLSHH